ncbi:unnamed protein product [Leptidea sinapis]|uniref:Uncharacterized protein n=1 Tax=Leptidea sinapis TaxID=189913 RepID=A0A5E4QJ54_9NEOP|nr:unnamed protein product [Leptidea sinapis]
MAEAKKREADLKKKAASVAPATAQRTTEASRAASASALQLLQSAYDDKKVDKEEPMDAMDGLSDSDLETLLKNFNELSAEEQHSLIAYLKKLEARHPTRVEKLRQYVSAAAISATAESGRAPNTVTVESEDEDYTVEEVFQSATRKFKEEKIRQEMEIVKKSLEAPAPALSPAPVPEQALVEPEKQFNIAGNMSSASDLLALVQASLQSTKMKSASRTLKTADSSTNQPISFGDNIENNPGESGNSIPIQISAPVCDNESWQQQSDSRSNQNFVHPNPELQYGQDNLNRSPIEQHISYQHTDPIEGQSYNKDHFNPALRGRFDNTYQGAQRGNLNPGPQRNFDNGGQDVYANRQPVSSSQQNHFENQQQYSNIEHYDNQDFSNNQQFDDQQSYENTQQPFDDQQSYENTQQPFDDQQNYGNVQQQSGNKQGYGMNHQRFGNQQKYGNYQQFDNQQMYDHQQGYGNNQQQYGNNHPPYGNKQQHLGNNMQSFGNKQNFGMRGNQTFGRPNRGRGMRGGRPGRGRGFNN